MSESQSYDGENPKKFSDRARALWAKSGDDTGSLNLPQHLMDASGVAEVLWDGWLSSHVKGWLADRLKLEEAEVAVLVSWLAGTHDLGKATILFQRQLEGRGITHFSDELASAGLSLAYHHFEQGAKIPHSTFSQAILVEWLIGEGLPFSVCVSLAQVAESHHGVPSKEATRDLAADIIEDYPEDWATVQTELLDLMAERTGVRPVLEKLIDALNAAELQVLTGLVIMADWIASNAEAFPMVTESDYRARVARGTEAIDLTPPWRPDSSRGNTDELYRQWFGWPEDYSARPVQHGALTAAREATGPTLMIIEAPTGEGKTEAGLGAAQILAAKTGAQGIMFAAPTMATANGLFNRVVDWAARTTPETEISSIYLAHSKNRLSREYNELRIRHVNQDGQSDHGATVASEWLRGPKKGMLSNFVVGTVDQVLMLALQTRHSMLRHLALAGKVIIIDEVHSYQAYMSSYLDMALKWLARYGVSVILMSATLPQTQKTRLARAYGGELIRADIECQSRSYPLVTTVTREGAVEKPIPPSPTQVTVELNLIADDASTLMDLLSGELVDGGCALIICNTIQRAQNTYDDCTSLFPGETELHHAAFIASERAEKEDDLRKKLGPKARRGKDRPYRRIIVSTQVAEQSLDIDADILITDIAPMDLLVQRMGRIHRHPRPASDRPARLHEAKTFIRGIEQLVPVPMWNSGAAYIYGEKLLMATLSVLQDSYLQQGFRRPADIAPAVHRVYADDPGVPQAWRQAWDLAVREAETEAAKAESRAQTYRIPSPQAAHSLRHLYGRYLDDRDTTLKGEEAGAAQVRDSDPTIEVIPIVMGENGYSPIDSDSDIRISIDTEPDRELAFQLAAATVRLPARFSKFDTTFDKVITQLELDTPPGWRNTYLLKGAVALVLNDDREIELMGETLRYSHARGLEIVFEECG